jgi:hypothetical protein
LAIAGAVQVLARNGTPSRLKPNVLLKLQRFIGVTAANLHRRKVPIDAELEATVKRLIVRYVNVARERATKDPAIVRRPLDKVGARTIVGSSGTAGARLRDAASAVQLRSR